MWQYILKRILYVIPIMPVRYGKWLAGVLRGDLGLQSPGAVSKGRVTRFGNDLSKLYKADLLKMRGNRSP